MLNPSLELLQELTNDALYHYKKNKQLAALGQWWEEDQSEYNPYKVETWAKCSIGKHGYEYFGCVNGRQHKVHHILYRQWQGRGIDLYFILDTVEPLNSYFTKEL